MSLDEGVMRDDSGDPITKEWLLSIGAEERFGGAGTMAFKGVDIFGAILWHPSYGVSLGAFPLRQVNTRGRLLHLLAAFGVEVWR